MKKNKLLIAGILAIVLFITTASFSADQSGGDTAVLLIIHGLKKEARVVVSKGANDVKTVNLDATMPGNWEENSKIIANVFNELSAEGYKVVAGGNERFVLQK